MISVIILHHDKAAYSRACLQSLLCSSARPLEIINVDNGSRDDTAALLAAWTKQAQAAGIEAQTLSFSENIGAVRGRNEAMQAARGDLLVFLDNDTLVAQSDWLEALRQFLEEHPQCGIVAPKLLFPWPSFQIECCGCGVAASGRIQYIGRGAAKDSIIEPQNVQCLISAAWMMRREVVAQIGALDELFSPVQYEDLDFCYRARGAGWQVWTNPRVELFHFEHTTTAGSSDINFRYVTTKNGLTFKRRWAPTFEHEDGPSDDEARWQTLAKHSIEDVDWQALLPHRAGDKISGKSSD